MNSTTTKIVQAHVVNASLLAICLSDGSTAVLLVEEILAFKPDRIASDAEYVEIFKS